MKTSLFLRADGADVRCPTAAARSSRRGVVTPLFRFVLCGFFIGGILAGGAMTARPVQADEFSTVPAGDPLYRHLAVVTEAGWRGVPQGRSSTLTRYEMALETARAIFTVMARQQANKAWAISVSKPALRALRALTSEFQVELRALEVDVAAAMQMYNSLLRLPDPLAPSSVAVAAAGTKPERFSEVTRVTARPGTSLEDPFRLPSAAAQRQREMEIPLSQRLRIQTALSVLARDAEDLFGDSALGVRHSNVQETQRSSGSAGTLSAGESIKANMAVGVTDWLTLRAGYGRSALAPSPMSFEAMALRDPSLPAVGQEQSMVGGVDVALRPGVRLSGNVENIEADTAAGGQEWTRIGGGLALSAWQNRLSLKANMSRLVPEDARVLPSTIAGLNVNLDVSERLSLTLLYQQLFSAPNPARPDRLVAGGININF